MTTDTEIDTNINDNKFSFKKLIFKTLSYIKTILIYFFIISIFSVFIFKFIPIPVTPTMIWNIPIQIFDENRNVGLKKKWVSLDKISKNIQISVISTEDQRFFEHYGFDFKAIEKALKNNENNSKIKGGSTISQQTAKNAFCLPHRNYFRKIVEAYFTILIELIWGKERIMEVYLNIIEFGDGIYGVEAASNHFFNKSASSISKKQAAEMAIVLPNPIKFKINKLNNYCLRRRNWTLKQMEHNKNILKY